MKNTFRTICGMVTLLAAQSVVSHAQISSNGNFTLTQTAIANGGASGTGASAAGPYSIEGTIGQSVAGQTAGATPFSIHAGFWNAQPLGPSAAVVSVSGRVTTANGEGIRNARIAMSSGDGQVRIAVTGSFGFYRFDDVAVGQSYVLEIRSKRFVFEPSTRVVAVVDELTEVSFIAEKNEN